MESTRRYLVLISVGILWSCVLGLQRPPPRYSQQYMPETSFSCRNKIVGSYYADPETDCQVFHVCVSVAGSIQDYKFLCPNDTAFDQESQTCADWYDVDCEAATLYYASDNFDLYRIGSGLESVHYDSLRSSDAEPQDHLQRSESSDAVRSSANTVNRVSSSNYNNREVLRSSSSGNLYNRNNKEDDYENEKSYKEDQDTKKKGGVRKVSRKQPYTGNGSGNYSPTTTTSAPVVSNQNAYNGNYYNNYNNQRSTTYVSSTTARPQDNYNRNQNTQRYSAPSSTYRPSTTYQDTYSNYQSPSTTAKPTSNAVYHTNFFNAYNPNYNQQNTGSSVQPTTLKPSSYNPKTSQQIYQFAQSTTVQPSTNYQTSDYTNYQQRSYNNIQRGSSVSVAYQSTTPAPTVYNNNYNNNNNNGQYRQPATSTSQDIPQTTAKYYPNNFASNSYAPTTYSPATKKYVNVDNAAAQTALRNTDNGQYFDKTSPAIKPSTQYYDSTKTPKKATQYNNYDNASSGKSYYIETSTGSFNLARSSVGIGFSPASINHLAESPRTTTPVPRRASSATTYNPNNFSSNAPRTAQPTTTPRGITYVSGSARPFTSTTRLPSSSGSSNSGSSTTARPKSGKKNDYDYAYYDTTGGLEYDGVDLEHVTSNKESTKIARN
ncbi:PREDICTED: GATA zinc finger domain-containing protein 14 isoform X2 [Vollenhovia emeryi]|uniref:GATA zinc finger domain-containing protein 14 isoform X2 n=1 Tax=Vollenhovia emeryi TaxID=411798 RepID=UPI0005F3DFB3|nr:PREDICTED: GATA zinc finger domain-containing protein 14 isoform X2 [Vollenhovia emeryi]